MSQTVCFNADNYPKMMAVPLKGKFLQEFMAYAHDNLSTQKLGIPPNSPMSAGPDADNIDAFTDSIVANITSQMDGAGAAKHGIDMNDLVGIIKEGTHHDVSSADIPKAYVTLHGKAPDQRTEVEEDTAYKTLIGQKLLHYFSLCLAVQEGKEKEFLGMNDRSVVETTDVLAQMGLHMYPAAAAQLLNMLASQTLLSERSIDMVKKRGAPTAELFEQTVFGKDGIGGTAQLMDVTLAIGNGVSLTKDRQKIRVLREGLLRDIAVSSGIPNRPLPSMEL